MALDMARGMAIEDHYTDRATLDFVEKFQEKAFAEWVSEDNDKVTAESGVRRGRMGGDGQDLTPGVPLKAGSDGDGLSVTDNVPTGGIGDDRRPSELVLRYLPLLSEALRNRLRPEEVHIGGGVGKREEDLTLLDDES